VAAAELLEGSAQMALADHAPGADQVEMNSDEKSLRHG
jgi:hypothetical protein